jgi:hypothetical protein
LYYIKTLNSAGKFIFAAALAASVYLLEGASIYQEVSGAKKVVLEK